MKTKILYTIIKYTPTMIKKLFCHIILLVDSKPTILEKIKYFILIIMTTAPVVWLIELSNKLYTGLSKWYILNMTFADFLLLAVLCNITAGALLHWRMKTFKVETFIVKNIIMMAVLILSYMILEMLHITMGQNVLADGFRVVIQLSALLYPGGKALKNLYILSNKQYPPAFIMEKLYTFEKTGNIKDLMPNNDEI